MGATNGRNSVRHFINAPIQRIDSAQLKAQPRVTSMHLAAGPGHPNQHWLTHILNGAPNSCLRFRDRIVTEPLRQGVL